MKGILFKPESIQAIIEGRKTQTRRVIKPQPRIYENYMNSGLQGMGITTGRKSSMILETPQALRLLPAYARYQVGETVYIKEAWYAEKRFDHLKPRDIPLLSLVGYPAEDVGLLHKPVWGGKLRSPMFLRYEFARYFITITDVRAERLQEITEADCYKEGIDFPDKRYEGVDRATRYLFSQLWNSINKDYPFESNPWVFPYTFRLEERR